MELLGHLPVADQQTISEKTITLTAWELEAVDAAEPYESGLGVPLDEAVSMARAQYQSWLACRPDQKNG